jgi:hypothetical protein
MLSEFYTLSHKKLLLKKLNFIISLGNEIVLNDPI